jgi:hypothetical protein
MWVTRLTAIYAAAFMAGSLVKETILSSIAGTAFISSYRTVGQAGGVPQTRGVL